MKTSCKHCVFREGNPQTGCEINMIHKFKYEPVTDEDGTYFVLEGLCKPCSRDTKDFTKIRPSIGVMSMVSPTSGEYIEANEILLKQHWPFNQVVIATYLSEKPEKRHIFDGSYLNVTIFNESIPLRFLYPKGMLKNEYVLFCGTNPKTLDLCQEYCEAITFSPHTIVGVEHKESGTFLVSSLVLKAIDSIKWHEVKTDAQSFIEYNANDEIKEHAWLTI